MTTAIEDNLKKKIKRDVYGKPQTVIVTFPPGLSDVALDETKSILGNLWFPQKFISELTSSKKDIRIDNIHLSAITELLMRSQCLSDIRLVIFEGKASGRVAFEKKCRSIHWHYFIDKKMSLKVKVDSVSCKAFNSTILKEILSEIVDDYVNDIVSGENANETTCVYADFYQEKLIISISLAGDRLYKRGYRGILSASAPLREDAASCCIRQSLHFAKQFNEQFTPDTVLIPFSGTGTFAFEYLQSHFNFAPVLFERDYALQKMPLFRSENFHFLLKKAREHCLFSTDQIENKIHVICIDNSKNANAALTENIALFKNTVIKNNFILPAELFVETGSNDNFLKQDIDKLMANRLGNIFIPLNPPYGIRLAKNSNSIALYSNIAHKINEMSKITKKSKKNVLGFILCPNEETWSAFHKKLTQAKIETYHFTQGGIDIRVCQFFI